MKIKLDKHLQEFLEEFALGEREIVLYLTLLKTGPNTIMNLARETAIKRSTTHNNIEELIKKGLVSQTNFGERRMVVAEDPEKLKFLLDQRKWRIKKVEDGLPSIIERIQAMVPESRENKSVDVKYYDGIDGVKYIYDLSLRAEKVYSFINLDKYYEVFPGTGDMFTEAFNKNTKREVWDIAVDSELAREVAKSHPRYYTAFLPESKNFSGVDFLIFDDSLAIIQLDPDNITGTIIKSKLVYESIVALHKIMWDLLS